MSSVLSSIQPLMFLGELKVEVKKGFHRDTEMAAWHHRDSGRRALRLSFHFPFQDLVQKFVDALVKQMRRFFCGHDFSSDFPFGRDNGSDHDMVRLGAKKTGGSFFDWAQIPGKNDLVGTP